ncbi:MAG TPA: Rrf2 family transcriptional regulator, partial [Caulobacter sp.]|nr:Rrf2 family transcriptional regulator [Caulobacter sp.]
AGGGAWLVRPAESITLDLVLRAVDGCTHLGVAPAGVKGCPVGERIPDAVSAAIRAADSAACQRLATITVADLLREPVPA